MNDTKRRELSQELYQLCLVPNDKFKFETEFVRMYELLTSLEEVENSVVPFCLQNDRTQSSFNEFAVFLDKNMNDLGSRVSIEPFGHADFGLKATRAFQKGEEVFRVPNKLILTTDTIKSSPISSVMNEDKLLSSMPNVSLAFLLLYLTSHTNEWSPYLNILPREFHTPLYFSLDEMKLLQASQSFDEIIYHVRNIARQYAYLLNIVDTKPHLSKMKTVFSYRNYKWAVSCVSTRQNLVVNEKKQRQLALIPLLDMCNHAEGEFCTDFDDESKSAVCLANRDVKSGEQLTIFYGYRSNVEMLIHNGFVPESNSYDYIKLKLGLSSQDPLLTSKVQLLHKFGLESSQSFKLDSIFSGSDRVYFFVKVFQEKSEETLNKMASYDSSNLIELVEQMEILKSEPVRQYIKTRLTLLLMSYKKINTELADDSTNRVFIKRLVHSEQDILKSIIERI